MPQFRLPGSDQIRLNALTTLLMASRNSVKPDDYISLQNLEKAAQYAQWVEKVIEHNALNMKLRLQYEKDFSQLYEKSRLFVLHYLQAVNMAIEREEIPVSIRKYYKLDVETGKLPNIRHEDELISVAATLFDGDARRMAEGGKYFTNPTIGMVKVWYDKFYEAWLNRRNMVFVKTGEIENVAAIRNEIDAFVGEVWAEVIMRTSDLPVEAAVEITNRFGLQYEMCDDDLFVTNCNAVSVKEPDISVNIEFAKESKCAYKPDNSLQFAFIFPEQES